jgi:hypothetical protein
VSHRSLGEGGPKPGRPDVKIFFDVDGVLIERDAAGPMAR